jgi:hypothetical protein
MLRRRRLKQTEPLKDRLASFAQDARAKAAELPPSIEGDLQDAQGSPSRHGGSHGRMDQLGRFAAAQVNAKGFR